MYMIVAVSFLVPGALVVCYIDLLLILLQGA